MLTDCCECSFVDTNVITGSCSSGFALFMAIVETFLLSKCDIVDPCRRLGKDSTQFPPLAEYDFIVVGAGVAGPIVASRLSEPRGGGDPWSVLLLEAGPEEPTGTQIPAYAVAAVGSELDWKYTTEPQENACRANGGICKWPRGKMVSGTGGMQGMMYTRGNRRIYDEWGVDGWSYDEVLPYFIKSENNKNPDLLDDGYHGFDGPLTVQRFSSHPLLSEVLLEAGKEMGYATQDVNGYNQTGFAIAQMMVDDGLRASTPRMYLRPHHHDRPNLSLTINAHVTKIIFDGNTARGVQFVDSSGALNIVYARNEVILSAGAVGTPHLLMLSGVGPKDHLNEVGIPVVADLAGVGSNLHNHVSIGVGFTVDEQAYQTLNLQVLHKFVESHEGPMASTGLTQNTAFMTSKYAETDFPDLQVFFDGYGAGCSKTGVVNECSDGSREPECGRRALYARPTNILPESKGYLKLRTANYLDYPAIFPNYFSAERDLHVLVDGLKLVLKLTNTEAMKAFGFQMDRTKAKGCENLEFGSDMYWACVVTTYTGPENHQSGTAKMGSDDDPEAVLDPRLRVRGVSNLRVVDASIFPLVPNSNPIAAIVMAAEKAADMIKEDCDTKDKDTSIHPVGHQTVFHAGDLISLLSSHYAQD